MQWVWSLEESHKYRAGNSRSPSVFQIRFFYGTEKDFWLCNVSDIFRLVN